MQSIQESNQSIHQLSHWLSEHFGTELFKSDFLRTKTIFAELLKKLSSKSLQVVTIAGTNGKGETALSLEWLLRQRKIKTALWTSPHILAANERFRFNGLELSIDPLLSTFKKLWIEVRDLSRCSYYEFLFYAFLNEVINREVDVMILEVGLGGRLDAVNLIDADIMCITSISRDHENILGKGYKKILMEKLGVSRTGRPLMTSLELNYLRDLVKEFCRSEHIEWMDLFNQKKLSHKHSYRQRNHAMAVTLADMVLKKMNLERAKENEIEHLALIRFKARMEELETPYGNFIFNGAHNVDGMRKFLIQMEDAMLKETRCDYTLVSFSHRKIEEVGQMLAMLCSHKDKLGEIFLCQYSHPKAFLFESVLDLDKNQVSFKDISGRLKGAIGVNYIGNTWEEKISNHFFAKKKIMVVGSYYFVGEVRQLLKTKTVF